MSEANIGAYLANRRAASNDFDDQRQQQAYDIANRAKIALSVNPWLGDDPEALMTVAQSGGPVGGSMIEQSAQLFGMQSTNQLMNTLTRLSPGAQRSAWGRLTEAQQGALGSMGYAGPQLAPEPQNRGLIAQAAGVLGTPFTTVGSGIKTAAGKTLNALVFMEQRVSNFYRAIRSMDGKAQWAALGGAAAGLALAPLTGGASLGAAGAFVAAGIAGGSALAGATVASMIASSPMQWWEAYQDTWDGERSFSRSSQKKALAMLSGDEQIASIARELAWNSDIEDIYDLTEEVAGTVDASGEQQMLASVARVAGSMAEEGTPEYQRAYELIYELSQVEEFQNAVRALERGKVSIGRDVAGLVGLDPGDRYYSTVSGGVDALWLIAMDPLLMAGKVRHFSRAQRFGIDLSGAAQGIARAVDTNKGVRRAFETMADAVNRGDFRQARNSLPEAQGLYAKMRAYKAEEAIDEFSVDSMLDYVATQDGMASIMAGEFGVKGESRLILSSIGSTRRVFNAVKLEARKAIDVLDDANLENTVLKWARKHGVEDKMDLVLPEELFDKGGYRIVDDFAAREGVSLGEGLGYAMRFVPGAKMIGAGLASLTAKLPPGTSINIGVDSLRSTQEIEQFVEMGRVFGVTSKARRFWTDAILAQDNKALRINAASAYVDTMLRAGGMHATEDGAKLAGEFLQKWRQTYGFADEAVVNGTSRRVGTLPMAHDATEIVIPDFTMMRRSMKRGHILKNVLNVTDAPLIEQGFMKFWKPAVLLRIGFIPRAAGEELVSLLSRVSVHDFGQTRAAAWHHQRDVAEVAARKIKESESIITDSSVMGKIVKPGKPYLMSAEEETAWLQRFAPGTRWAGNMLDRTSFGRPLVNVIERYSKFLDRATREGLTDITLPPIESATTRWQAGARAMTQTIFAGHPTSIRRMILNGVDPDIRMAVVDGWFAQASTDVMKEVSAKNASVVAAERPSSNTITTLVPNQRGELGRQVEQVVIRGRRQYIDGADTQFQAGLHSFQQEVFTDTVVAPAIADVLPGYVDATLNLPTNIVDELDEIVTGLDVMVDAGLVPDDVASILRVITGSNKETTWRGVAARIRQSDQRLATALFDAFDAGTALTPGALMDVLRRYDKMAPLPGEKFRSTMLGQRRGGEARIAPGTVKDLQASLTRLDELYSTADSGQEAWMRQYVTARRGRANMKRTTSYTEMENELIEQVRLQLLEPINQRYTRGSVKAHTIDGRFMDSPAPDGTVRLFAPRNSAKVVDAVRQSFSAVVMEDFDAGIESMLRLFKNRSARYARTTDKFDPSRIDDNVLRSIFRRFMELPADDTGKVVRIASDIGSPIPVAVVGTSDPRVARAVSHFFEDVAGARRPSSAIAEFDISDDVAFLRAGVETDGVTPIHFDGPAGQRVFTVDIEKLGDRGLAISDDVPLHEASVGYSYEEMVARMAEDIVRNNVLGRFRDLSGTRAVRRADDMVIRSRNDVGDLEDIAPGSKISRRQEFEDEAGNPIAWGSPEYFDVENMTATERLTWESIGPMIEDHFDQARKQTLFFTRRQSDRTRKLRGEIEDRNIGIEIPALRSSPDDAGKIPGALQPDVVQVEQLALRDQTLFESYVTRGFDGIATVLDAVVRRPMAMHYYVNAYIENAKYMKFLYDQPTMQRATDITQSVISDITKAASNDALTMGYATTLARARGTALPASPFEARVQLAMAYDIRDADSAEYVFDLMRRQSSADGTLFPRGFEREVDEIARWAPLVDEPTGEMLVHRMKAVGSGKGANGGELPRNLVGLTDEQYGALEAARQTMQYAHDVTAQLAGQRAIANIMPFLDSHELRSQFAEWGKGLMPFWYAEENFLKRMARTALLAPEAIRKMQLTYMGVQSVGLIRTDENGQDWFVYPGSQALGDALAPFMGMPGIGQDGGTSSMGLFFQARTDQLLPGYSHDVARPAFAPLITVAVDSVVDMFPELQPFQTSIMGEMASTRGKFDQLVPSTISRALTGLGITGQDKYASATMSAFAMMAANGQIPDNPTAFEREEIMKRAQNHARMTLLVQAVVGFVAPGAPSAGLTGGGEGMDFAAQLGFGNDDIGKIFNAEYRELISNLGIDEGTTEYLKRNADHDMFDFVNPMAFAVSRSSTPSGAPIPASMKVMDHYADHEGWYQQYQLGGPWLFPQDDVQEFEGAAYNEQVANNLRKRRTPEEFMTEFYRKQGSIEYFKMKTEYEELRDAASTAGERRTLDAQWKARAALYLQNHPVFAEELQSTDSRQRRDAVLADLVVAVADPQRPQSEHGDRIAEMVESFQRYETQRQLLSMDRTSAGQEKLKALKTKWKTWATDYVLWHPSVEGFWVSVLEPSSEL